MVPRGAILNASAGAGKQDARSGSRVSASSSQRFSFNHHRYHPLPATLHGDLELDNIL